MAKGVTPLPISILSPIQLTDKNTEALCFTSHVFYLCTTSLLNEGRGDFAFFKGPSLVRYYISLQTY
ncbi:hypothetical protein LIAUS_00755 [Leptospira interrogans]